MSGSNGLEEGEDVMTDEEAEGVDAEGEAGAVDRGSASRPKKQANCKREGRTQSNTHAIPRLVRTQKDGQRSYSSPRVEEKM